MIDEPRVYMRHIRQAGMCAHGIRAFANRHGIDFKEFVENGLPVSVLEATGDAMALKVVEIAKNGQQQ